MAAGLTASDRTGCPLSLIGPSRLLKKVFGRSRCATLIQPSILGRTKDSPPRDFGFENYASSTDFPVFQQPARDIARDRKAGLSTRDRNDKCLAGRRRPLSYECVRRWWSPNLT